LPRKTTPEPSAKEVAHEAAERMAQKKGNDVVILDLRKHSGTTDFFVIGSGATEVQVRALSDAVIEGLEEKGVTIYHVEGYQARRWVLLDCVDVVVHVFLEELREFYGLERLWGDAPIERLEE
jgi:ribosome-associated protein